MTIAIGTAQQRAFTVEDGDTAIAMGSGDVPVLGTPRLLAWCEAVTVMTLAPQLAAGDTSVGYRIRLDHLAPTAVGRSVEVTATVSEVDGRQVTLALRVVDTEGREVAQGSVTRVVVGRDRFMAGLRT